MKRTCIVAILVVFLLTAPPTRGEPGVREEVNLLQAEFARYTGARLVFQAGDLPAGHYHDTMPSLAVGRRIQARAWPWAKSRSCRPVISKPSV